MRNRIVAVFVFLAVAISFFLLSSRRGISQPAGPRPIPAEIQAIFQNPKYKDAVWGLRVVDLDTGELLHDLLPERDFLIGSVRKLFSVGLLLNEVGPQHRFETPVYAQGPVTSGTLQGNLILVASGDLTMGGRTNSDGTLAVSDYDHNEADSLGNAVLTRPDPLAGYVALANQVAASGIRRIEGDVIIDDRLFVPFNFRDEFSVRPIFVNDDVVDVSIRPGAPGQAAQVESRPASRAFSVESSLQTAPPGSESTVTLEPELPRCFGTENCKGQVSGALPVDLSPPLTGAFPLVQTFRITEPSNYARTVFIEALQRAGVSVSADALGANPVQKLPAADAYAGSPQVASLTSPPFSEVARYILKVSYNIGADTSLVLFGLTQGVNTMEASLEEERKALASDYGIAGTSLRFIDGSGGGNTTAALSAVSQLLLTMSGRPTFPAYRNALPVLGEDGSLAFVTDYQDDPSLTGATGQVRAKTGTFVQGTEDGPSLRAQALAGYIDTRNGKRLGFVLAVNDVGVIPDLTEVLEVFQDQGKISALLWRDH